MVRSIWSGRPASLLVVVFIAGVPLVWFVVGGRFNLRSQLIPVAGELSSRKKGPGGSHLPEPFAAGSLAFVEFFHQVAHQFAGFFQAAYAGFGNQFRHQGDTFAHDR